MKKRLLTNYPQKMLSFLIAAGVWWYVTAAHNPRFHTAVTAPVKYENLPLGYALNDAPGTVELTLTGDPGAVAAVTLDKLSASVNLEGLGAGRHTLPVKVDNRTPAAPAGRRPTVEVSLVKLARARRPVRVGFYGSLRSGLVVGAEQYEPVEVDVYGAAEQVAKVRYARANIDLTPHGESFEKEVRLAPLDRKGLKVAGVALDPAAARVEIGIRNEGNKVVAVVLRLTEEAGAPPEQLRTELLPSAAPLIGRESDLEPIEAVETAPFDWTKCRAGGIFTVDLVIPANVSSPVRSVSLSCSLAEGAEHRFTVPIEAINLGDGLKAELAPAVLEVILDGGDAALRGIGPRDVSASVDLLGLGAGAHLVAPSVSLREERAGVEVTTRLEKVEVRVVAE